MRRREFIQTTIAAGAALAGGASAMEMTATDAQKSVQPRLRERTEPLAIAMWDFSWLLRRHPAGEFEDWDQVLDELVDRGYNAIRADVFPHLVASRPDGTIRESYHFPKGDWKPAMWGNKFSVTARPREGLIEFLRKCRDRGVMVGYSTWFFGPGVDEITELDGLVRVWDETLGLIEAHGLLDTCLYVDLLNEYPMFHGFSWFTKQLDSLKDAEAGALSEVEREAHQWSPEMGDYNEAQWAYYRWFGSEAIRRLRARRPQLDYGICQTTSGAARWDAMDHSEYNFLDIHLWAVLHGKLPTDTGYWENIHGLADNDEAFPEVSARLRENWRAHKEEIVAWMDVEMGAAAARSRELGVPLGNTEGWGIINWLDHPALGWDIIKEAAEIAAELGRKHGYLFNCTSNFTHPQFPGYWRDVAWHRRVTGIIRGTA